MRAQGITGWSVSSRLAASYVGRLSHALLIAHHHQPVSVWALLVYHTAQMLYIT